MTFSTELRILGMLRRIAKATEGIRDQMEYRNQRTFPPLNVKAMEPRKLVITKRAKDQDGQA